MIEQGRQIAVPEFNYGISTANVLDKATIHFAFGWGLGQHVQTANKAGLDGVEVWATRPINALQSVTGFISDETKKHILSTHQSSRILNVFDSLATLSPEIVAQAVLLPHINTSLGQLESLHRHIDRNIPAVLYRETPAEFHKQTHIEKRIIQPDPEVCRDWDVQSAQDFIQKMREKGFTGICLDITHIRRGGQDGSAPSVLANWQDSVTTFLQEGVIEEVHIALGRIDPDTAKSFGKEKTLSELKDLYDGTSHTDATQILHFLAQKGWKGQMIFEVLPSAILEVTNSPSRFMTQKDLVVVYERLRNNLYKIFNN